MDRRSRLSPCDRRSDLPASPRDRVVDVVHVLKDLFIRTTPRLGSAAENDVGRFYAINLSVCILGTCQL